MTANAPVDILLPDRWTVSGVGTAARDVRDGMTFKRSFSRGLFGKAIAYGLPFGGRFFPVVSSSQSRNGLMMRPSPFMSWRPHWVLATWTCSSQPRAGSRLEDDAVTKRPGRRTYRWFEFPVLGEDRNCSTCIANVENDPLRKSCALLPVI